MKNMVIKIFKSVDDINCRPDIISKNSQTGGYYLEFHKNVSQRDENIFFTKPQFKNMENKLMGSKICLIRMLKVQNKASGREEIFRKIMAVNFPDVLREAPNLGSINENTCTSRHILVKSRHVKKKKSLGYQKENTDFPQKNDSYILS